MTIERLRLFTATPSEPDDAPPPPPEPLSVPPAPLPNPTPGFTPEGWDVVTMGVCLFVVCTALFALFQMRNRPASMST